MIPTWKYEWSGCLIIKLQSKSRSVLKSENSEKLDIEAIQEQII